MEINEMQKVLSATYRNKNLFSGFIHTLGVFATRRLVITFDKIEFEFTHLPWGKICNWFLAEASFLFKTKKSWAYPTHYQMEPASGCNLRCPMCYITTQNISRGTLSLNHFKKFIDEISDYAFLLHFWGWGEPFMNKDIFTMIKYAREKGLRVLTSTNAHFLAQEDITDKLIDSGLDALIVALDGVDHQTYEHYRKQGDFDKVIGSVRLLTKRRKEKNTSLPMINLRMVVSRENEHQIPAMKALATDLGVDMLTLKTLWSHGNDGLWEKSLPVNHEYRRYSYDTEGRPIRKKNSCKRMWNHTMIHHDGSVTPCSYYLREESELGKAFGANDETFSRIWFSDAFRKTREDFLKFRNGRSPAHIRCQICGLNYTTPDGYVSHAFYF